MRSWIWGDWTPFTEHRENPGVRASITTHPRLQARPGGQPQHPGSRPPHSPRQRSQASGPAPEDLGLWTLLSMLLLMPGPVQAGAPRPMCDPRVLEMFIRETQDAEKAAAACGAACDLPDILMLPETKVNFNEWQQMSWPARVQEVWGGHTLLVTALCRARELVTEPGTRVTLERMHNVVRGVGQILRNHEAKPPPLAPPPGSPARSVLRLLGAQSNFLRGKVSLLLADACRGGGPT